MKNRPAKIAEVDNSDDTLDDEPQVHAVKSNKGRPSCSHCSRFGHTAKQCFLKLRKHNKAKSGREFYKPSAPTFTNAADAQEMLDAAVAKVLEAKMTDNKNNAKPGRPNMAPVSYQGF